MDAKFLLKRMDENHRELREEIIKLREEIAPLKAFKEKAAGIAILVTILASWFLEFLRKN